PGGPWRCRGWADGFQGRTPSRRRTRGGVTDTLLEHARLLCSWMGEEHAIPAFRRHTTWYTKGFRGSARLRQSFMQARTLAELEALVADVDRSEPFPPGAMRVPRGKTAGTQKVSLPAGYLEDREDATPPDPSAEDAFSGG